MEKEDALGRLHREDNQFNYSKSLERVLGEFLAEYQRRFTFDKS